MSFEIKSPTMLGEAIDARVICAKKNTRKDSENQEDKQVTAQEFLLDYLADTAGMCIEGKGKEDERINAKTAAVFSMLIERYLTGVDGDNIPHYLYADSLFSCRVYNGRFFERMDLSAFSFLIKRFLVESQVGVVYQQNCPKKIAEEVLATLWHTGQRWQPDSSYFVFSNGVLDIENMSLVPFSEDYCTNNIFEVEYQPTAKRKEFEKCLNDALDSNEQKVLQEMCGYLLFPDCRHEKIGVLVGNGRNGKSVILRAISHALGDANGRVCHYNLQQLTDSNGICIANSIGAIANICYDSGNVIKLGNEAIFKQYVSGEPILCKVLYQQPTETTAYPKSIIAVNELPQSSDFSDGYFRRFLLLPFNRQIPLEKVDKQLDEKLRAESVGILLWVLEGYKRLIAQKDFTTSAVIDAVQNRYRTESDSVATYLAEFGYIPSEFYSLTLSEFFLKFSEWRISNGYASMSRRKFADRLRHLGYKVERGNANKTYVWVTTKSYESNSENVKTIEELPF